MSLFSFFLNKELNLIANTTYSSSCKVNVSYGDNVSGTFLWISMIVGTPLFVLQEVSVFGTLF